MSQTIQMADCLAEAIGLETWMLRVLERADKVGDGWGEDDIHDLRVALRRCRTMADALSRVNPDSIWRKVRKSTRDLFRALGELRDTQMERVWLKKLWPGRDPARARLMRELLRREVGQKEAARKALAKFDRKGWKKWARKIAPKAGFFPLESVVFQRLALSELNGCAMLFGRARKGPSAVAWHRARIGLKRFRYIAENFLPRRYEACAREVKRLQDLLGEVHDLDVLKADARKIARGRGSAEADAWLEKIQDERKTRLSQVAALTAGAESVLPTWRNSFLLGHTLAALPLDQRRTA